MNFKSITFSIADSIGYIILNRPEVLNSLNRDMVSEIHKAVNMVKINDAMRALIFSGCGGNFAAGADIINMVDMTPRDVRKFSFNNTYNAIEDLSIPVIAAISGYALGGGLELALACDFRICSVDAKLGFPEITIGIFPGAGGTQRLPRLIGQSRAKEMIFFGRAVNAQTAFQWGLCDRMVDGEPLDEAIKMANSLLKSPPLALSAAKKAVVRGLGLNLRFGIQYEYDLWARLFSTEDQKEGMKAFLEKRKPVFKGK